MILRYIYINSQETTISVRNAVNCLLTSVMVWVPAESDSKFNSHYSCGHLIRSIGQLSITL